VPLLGATRNEGYISGHLDRVLEMTVYSVADAKNRLPTLIDKALSGEEVIITRRGKPVVEFRPTRGQPEPPVGSDEWLFQRTRARPRVDITSVELLNLIYEPDED
jgi:antitoxin (DNA-binding transcriptional repressor) of toxin-antitoxin stability system